MFVNLNGPRGPGRKPFFGAIFYQPEDRGYIPVEARFGFHKSTNLKEVGAVIIFFPVPTIPRVVSFQEFSGFPSIPSPAIDRSIASWATCGGGCLGSFHSFPGHRSIARSVWGGRGSEPRKLEDFLQSAPDTAKRCFDLPAPLCAFQSVLCAQAKGRKRVAAGLGLGFFVGTAPPSVVPFGFPFKATRRRCALKKNRPES